MFKGERLKKMREARGLTTQVLANEVGASQSLVSAMENGTRLPNANLLKCLAIFFNASLDDFYTDGLTGPAQ